MRTASGLLVSLVAVPLAVLRPATAEESGDTRPVTLRIFDTRVSAAVPGIGAVISLTEEQRKQVEQIYNEVFGAQPVTDAAKVLQNKESSVEEVQTANTALTKARETFLERCQGVFTPEQSELIRRIYKAYNETVQAAYQEMLVKVRFGFAARLEEVLTPEQKAAVVKARTDTAAAHKAEAEKKAEDAGSTEGAAPAE